MKKYFYLILPVFLFASSMIFTGCRDKEEQPMIDIESIDYDGSHDNRYIFRDELQKEQEKKERQKRLQKEEME